MQRLRGGQTEAEVQLEHDSANHPELRGPIQAKETGAKLFVKITFKYLCQENRRVQIYQTSCPISCSLQLKSKVKNIREY